MPLLSWASVGLHAQQHSSTCLTTGLLLVGVDSVHLYIIVTDADRTVSDTF